MSTFTLVFTVLWLCLAVTGVKAIGNSARINESSLSGELYRTLSFSQHLDVRDKEAAHVLKHQLSNVQSKVDSISAAAANTTDLLKKAAIACHVYRHLFPQAVIAEDPDYTLERQAHWSQTCWLPAACFVRPQNTVRVAAIRKVATYVGVQFAIRSGGHNPNAGFASVGSTGVLVDMQDLDRLEVQDGADMDLVAGPGNRWNTVYHYLNDDYRRGIIGGRTGDVGVPGFLLGGGMSFFPNLYGLGADSVTNFKCVLANSTIINANKNNQPRLFKVLKGGGSNFAIVTEFTIRTHPIQDIWYSLDFYASTDYKAVLNATAETQIAMESDPRMGFFNNVQPDGFMVGKFYTSASGSPVIKLIFKYLNSC